MDNLKISELNIKDPILIQIVSMAKTQMSISIICDEGKISHREGKEIMIAMFKQSMLKRYIEVSTEEALVVFDFCKKIGLLPYKLSHNEVTDLVNNTRKDLDSGT